jgi:hypothetical protein
VNSITHAYFRQELRHEIIFCMRHSLYRYFTERKWADEFLDGKMRFRSLAYYRDYENECEAEKVRKDDKEGNLVFGPPGGLLITNQTQATTGTLPGFQMESRTKQAEIFVLCASRYFSEEVRSRFGAVVCVEILKIAAFCERIKQALPQNATFFAGKVTYYDPTQGPEERWALPDLIARSKFKCYEWQREYRFLFSLTDALGFENATYRLIRGDHKEAPKPEEHLDFPVHAKNLRDICRLREFQEGSARSDLASESRTGW